MDRGRGIDAALGTKAVRGDQKESPDYSKPGIIIAIGPIKGEARAKEKVESDYGGDWSRLTDVVRASVAVDTMDDLHHVMGVLRESGMKVVAQPKDRFAAPTEAGYRDLMFRVEYPNGHIGELQLHLKPILLAKSKAHKLYERTRSISAQAQKEGRTTMTDDEVKIVEEANATMKEIYGQAWQQASEGGTPAKTAAAKTIYFEFGDLPAKWEYRKFPVKVVKGKEVVVYDLEEFFHNARRIPESKYQTLLKEQK